MNDNFDDAFFDTSEVDEIDRMIAEDLAKPTLNEQLEQQENKKVARKMAWLADIKQFWPVYLIMVISGLFTTMLAVYMGLAPYLRDNLDGTKTLVFNTDAGHVLTAIVYAAAFLTVTEGMFTLGKIYFHRREQTNGTQAITMLIVMAIAFISVIGTGIAGGQIVASTLGFLQEFVKISPAAQKWVVRVIPILLGIDAALFTAYGLSSRKAKAQRRTRDERDKRQQDHETRMEQIELIGERYFQVAEIKLYKRAVASGALSAAEATAARRAGKTLQQLEKELGRDLDGNHDVGTVEPEPEPEPVSASQSPNGRKPMYARRNFTTPAPKRTK